MQTPHPCALWPGYLSERVQLDAAAERDREREEAAEREERAGIRAAFLPQLAALTRQRWEQLSTAAAATQLPRDKQERRAAERARRQAREEELNALLLPTYPCVDECFDEVHMTS